MIKLLIDSASEYELAESKKEGFEFLPITIRFGEREYADGVDITHREFFEKLIESSSLPQTSQINEFRFNEKFRELTKDGSFVIVITLSSKLSGTYNCAVKASENYGGRVFVVDSLNASVGERVLVQYAKRLIGEYDDPQIIVDKLNEKKGKIQLLAMLDTLVYLRKGGRISSISAIAGGMLSIKPVISIIDGEVKVVGKAIGSKKGNNLLCKLIDDCGGVDFGMPYVLGYSGLSDECLKKYIADSEHLWKGNSGSLPSVLVGSTIGTHIGPNAIAVAFFAK